VGVGSGSDCGVATRERARLCLVFFGSEAASFTTSEFGPERVVRLGLPVASTFAAPLFALASPPERPRPLVYAPDQVVLPASNGAVNRRGPSGGDFAANPSVSGIHPRSSRVDC